MAPTATLRGRDPSPNVTGLSGLPGAAPLLEFPARCLSPLRGKSTDDADDTDGRFRGLASVEPPEAVSVPSVLSADDPFPLNSEGVVPGMQD